MINKLKKHSHILGKRLNSSSEESRLRKVDNQYLHLVYDIIKDAKSEKFSSEDLDNFKSCELYRSSLLQSSEVISYEIFGSDRTALVKDICSKAASSKSWCRLIYNLVKKSDSKTVFEVGTNLGISGSYILNALSSQNNRKFITLEGLDQLCKISGKQFGIIDEPSNFKIWSGLYDDTFDSALNSIDNVDCAFIDGNHQYEPTLEYFEKLLPLIQEKGLLIFDDINWSDGMKKAWKEIKASDKINFSIDLFEIGIAIIDKKHQGSKEQFSFHYDY